MAVDGTKIIDSDLARDTYEGIMDLYDSGAEIAAIEQEFPFVRTESGYDADFYHEIFVTSYALAFWEIGAMKKEILDEVTGVTELGAGAKVWREEGGETEAKKRQKELDRLLRKISAPNTKIRKRKKYRIIKNLFFQPDDVLAFRVSDGSYRAVICAKVTQHRGQCTYDLVATTYAGGSKPTIEGLAECSIAGHKIGSGYDANTMVSLQPGIDEIWKHSNSASPFYVGLAYHLVTHPDMIKLKSNFERIGELKIKDSFKKDGSYGYKSNFEEFESMFSDLGKHFFIWGTEVFPVSILCEI